MSHCAANVWRFISGSTGEHFSVSDESLHFKFPSKFSPNRRLGFRDCNSVKWQKFRKELESSAQKFRSPNSKNVGMPCKQNAL